MLLQLHDPRVWTIITMWVGHQLVKSIIILEPYVKFRSNFAFLFILILLSHWYAKRWLGFNEKNFLGEPTFVQKKIENSNLSTL